MAKIASMPKLNSRGFAIPNPPSPEDLIRGAVEADLPKPDRRIVQAVNRAAAAANFDAKTMLADPVFLKRAAVANPADTNAVTRRSSTLERQTPRFKLRTSPITAPSSRSLTSWARSRRSPLIRIRRSHVR
jgi:hypothetical protein